ncbi:aldehyde dehydrogenase [Halalkalibacter urbisdiaboli]|uniref:aldehyde dehydrogenase n=1 Tax=Halalkalibacter urbisdiaboli TaxID=1960589 RepID=UPI000B45259C|nr:aldehyde dehydrogenase [Halalkalibacter urbisdiaboli]
MKSYTRLREKQKQFFYSGITKEYSFRIKQLKCFSTMLKNNEKKLLQALNDDLNKSYEEAFLTEMGPLYQELSYMIKHLPEWTKAKKVKTATSHVGSKGYIYHEPYGVALIIAPWNYPLQLALAPVIGALAAGNCVVLKPSEFTPHTSSVLSEIVRDTFSDEYFTVVEGAVETSQQLLAEPFDYIFFTGSVNVGKAVMEAAAKHLTPVTLELGGKSPAIVHEDAKLDLAAKRIAWGKFINAGQTCVAPDYVLVHEQIKEQFLSKLNQYIDQLFTASFERNRYPRIVTNRHFTRLLSFLDDGDIYLGGHFKEEDCVLSPTVLTNVSLDSNIMKEEIFGPILPIIPYQKIEEVLYLVREQPNPLALYVFTENKEIEQKIIHGLSFGGGCVNDTILHLATPHLPFGGVGASGMGAYHGYESFNTFSHRKSILKQTTAFDLPIRYKQGKVALALLRKLFK